MNQGPEISVLSPTKRAVFFWLLFIIFAVSLPTLIFYTSGKRLNFDEGNATSVVSMGGIYLGNELDTVQVFVDDVPIDKNRLFRRALYLEDIAEGNHNVHVQDDGLQTWVKNLPVFAGLVTEALSFNMPAEPQVRLITPKEATDGTAVVQATSSDFFVENIISNGVTVATSTRTYATFADNPEYEYVVDLFSATSTAVVTESVATQLSDAFSFASEEATTTASTTIATTTVLGNNIALREVDDGIEALWTGDTNRTPYYFCVHDGSVEEITAWYGEHVAADVEVERMSGTLSSSTNNRVCRSSIALDTQNQPVVLFDFVPNNPDLVLLHRADGIFVTEIDDRAWQNNQPLYLGADLQVIIDNGQILVFDGEQYFEIILTLAAQG